MMDAPAAKEWYLRKHKGGTLSGPLPFEQLSRWAWAAQIAPHDALSTDNETWIKAPMLPELGLARGSDERTLLRPHDARRN